MANLVELARACATSTTVDQLTTASTGLLEELATAQRVAVLAPAIAPRIGGDGLAACTVPTAWSAAGITVARGRELPGDAGTLVIGWAGAAPEVSPDLGVALSLLDSAIARINAEARLTDLASRVDNAQHLADMGDYDWHIPSDTNLWSDQLYRIYGYEPHAFDPNYEAFLSHIHPEDRERITAIHQHAYATGEPYQMIERIVRPDGTIRHLSSNGEVIMGPDGTPIRMRGTCVDITDRVLVQQEREHLAARFRALVESAPDAILVLDRAGRVVHSNGRATELLGGDPTGEAIERLVPDGVGHEELGAPGTGVDGRPLVLDLHSAVLSDVDDPGLVAVFLRDATPRRDGEALAARLRESQIRRRQALEINDNVVQGLVAASYALEQRALGDTGAHLTHTLDAARRMMDDLLEPLEGADLRPGDLVRTEPTVAADVPAPAESRGTGTSCRVLVVDDSADLRNLLRLKLSAQARYDVVGEAVDGIDAIAKTAELQPDLVLLDMAMPRMDGLEALPQIRTSAPSAHVVVLSGFNESTLAAQAMSAGADRYVVKGGSMRALIDVLDDVTTGSGRAAPAG
ncbi:response regulator [Nocardioides terrisoli]|uniref:response regulator n=1 Tax=Nocardioides terrisoli TaxID=3388267 RepID=UPI00287B8C74|nr:response regulator [Nocardioides marmorisolisilvae]